MYYAIGVTLPDGNENPSSSVTKTVGSVTYPLPAGVRFIRLSQPPVWNRSQYHSTRSNDEENYPRNLTLDR